MQGRSTTDEAVIDLAAYRKNKHPTETKPIQWTPAETALLIDEVSHYLLKAVRALRTFPSA